MEPSKQHDMSIDVGVRGDLEQERHQAEEKERREVVVAKGAFPPTPVAKKKSWWAKLWTSDRSVARDIRKIGQKILSQKTYFDKAADTATPSESAKPGKIVTAEDLRALAAARQLTPDEFVEHVKEFVRLEREYQQEEAEVNELGPDSGRSHEALIKTKTDLENARKSLFSAGKVLGIDEDYIDLLIDAEKLRLATADQVKIAKEDLKQQRNADAHFETWTNIRRKQKTLSNTKDELLAHLKECINNDQKAGSYLELHESNTLRDTTDSKPALKVIENHLSYIKERAKNKNDKEALRLLNAYYLLDEVVHATDATEASYSKGIKDIPQVRELMKLKEELPVLRKKVGTINENSEKNRRLFQEIVNKRAEFDKLREKNDDFLELFKEEDQRFITDELRNLGADILRAGAVLSYSEEQIESMLAEAYTNIDFKNLALENIKFLQSLKKNIDSGKLSEAADQLSKAQNGQQELHSKITSRLNSVAAGTLTALYAKAGITPATDEKERKAIESVPSKLTQAEARLLIACEKRLVTTEKDPLLRYFEKMNFRTAIDEASELVPITGISNVGMTAQKVILESTSKKEAKERFFQDLEEIEPSDTQRKQLEIFIDTILNSEKDFSVLKHNIERLAPPTSLRNFVAVAKDLELNEEQISKLKNLLLNTNEKEARKVFKQWLEDNTSNISKMFTKPDTVTDYIDETVNRLLPSGAFTDPTYFTEMQRALYSVGISNEEFLRELEENQSAIPEEIRSDFRGIKALHEQMFVPVEKEFDKLTKTAGARKDFLTVEDRELLYKLDKIKDPIEMNRFFERDPKGTGKKLATLHDRLIVSALAISPKTEKDHEKQEHLLATAAMLDNIIERFADPENESHYATQKDNTVNRIYRENYQLIANLLYFMKKIGEERLQPMNPWRIGQHIQSINQFSELQRELAQLSFNEGSHSLRIASRVLGNSKKLVSNEIIQPYMQTALEQSQLTTAENSALRTFEASGTIADRPAYEKHLWTAFEKRVLQARISNIPDAEIQLQELWVELATKEPALYAKWKKEKPELQELENYYLNRPIPFLGLGLRARQLSYDEDPRKVAQVLDQLKFRIILNPTLKDIKKYMEIITECYEHSGAINKELSDVIHNVYSFHGYPQLETQIHNHLKNMNGIQNARTILELEASYKAIVESREQSEVLSALSTPETTPKQSALNKAFKKAYTTEWPKEIDAAYKARKERLEFEDRTTLTHEEFTALNFADYARPPGVDPATLKAKFEVNLWNGFYKTLLFYKSEDEILSKHNVPVFLEKWVQIMIKQPELYAKWKKEKPEFQKLENELLAKFDKMFLSEPDPNLNLPLSAKQEFYRFHGGTAALALVYLQFKFIIRPDVNTLKQAKEITSSGIESKSLLINSTYQDMIKEGGKREVEQGKSVFNPLAKYTDRHLINIRRIQDVNDKTELDSVYQTIIKEMEQEARGGFPALHTFGTAPQHFKIKEAFKKAYVTEWKKEITATYMAQKQVLSRPIDFPPIAESEPPTPSDAAPPPSVDTGKLIPQVRDMEKELRAHLESDRKRRVSGAGPTAPIEAVTEKQKALIENVHQFIQIANTGRFNRETVVLLYKIIKEKDWEKLLGNPELSQAFRTSRNKLDEYIRTVFEEHNEENSVEKAQLIYSYEFVLGYENPNGPFAIEIARNLTVLENYLSGSQIIDAITKFDNIPDDTILSNCRYLLGLKETVKTAGPEELTTYETGEIYLWAKGIADMPSKTQQQIEIVNIFADVQAAIAQRRKD